MHEEDPLPDAPTSVGEGGSAREEAPGERAEADFANLLAATEIAALFLDKTLSVRRFTPAMRTLFGLTEADLGRPAAALAQRIGDYRLAQDAEEVLRRSDPREGQATGHDGSTFVRRVSACRTVAGEVDGAIAVFSLRSAPGDVARKLRRRERQQAGIAEIGQAALTGEPSGPLFNRAARIVAERLECRFAKVLQHDAASGEFTIRGNHGFPPGLAGRPVPGGAHSQAGFALLQRAPVIVENLAEETRFSPPEVLTRNGIVCGISVVIGGGARPWGVFSVHATERRIFSLDDVSFVQSAANMLAATIERRAVEFERDSLNARLEQVLESAQLASWMWEPETDRAVWDHRLTGMAGLPANAPVVGKAFFDRVHPEDLPMVTEALRRVAEEGAEYNAEFRIIRNGEVRWLAGKGSLQAGPGPRRVFGVNFDITDRKESELRLLESEARREMALEAADLGTWEWRPGSDVMRWDARMFRIAGMAPQEAVPIEEYRRRVHPEDWERRMENIMAAIETGGGFANEYRYVRDGEEVWLGSTGKMFHDRGGSRVVGITRDISRRKREEARQQMLMAELDHRVKNILANVIAIARQTGSVRPDPEEFIEVLEGRLSAMADAHSLLSMSRWTGVDLHQLLEAELSPYVSTGHSRIRMEGPPVTLSPKAAQTMSLFLHELATNAAKYGALSHPDGRIGISWHLPEGRFRLSWQEAAAVPVAPPLRRGFGFSVIEEMTGRDLDGEVTIRFDGPGLACRLDAPATEVIATGGSMEVPMVTIFGNRRLAAPGPLDAPSVPPLNVLIVEDIWTVAMHLKGMLEAAGHRVVGPGARADESLALAEVADLDAAILDIRLDRELVFPVADRLVERGIPFSFASGYSDVSVLPERFEGYPRLPKPYTRDGVHRFLASIAAGA